MKPAPDPSFAREMLSARMERKPRYLTQAGLHRLVVNEFGRDAISLRTIERIEGGRVKASARAMFQIRKVIKTENL